MGKFWTDFKAFVTRGNVIDMAVGVIIAGAFGKITASLVNDVVMPFIAWIFGAQDMSGLNIVLREAQMEGETVVTEAITLGIGNLVGTIIDFILIAFVVFMLLKVLNAAKRKKEEAPAEPPAPPAPTKEEELLTEIRDLLKNK